MTQVNIEISQKGLRVLSVEKLVVGLVKKAFPDAEISLQTSVPPESRPERFEHAKSTIEGAKAEMEYLRDELQDWYDNLPENFQNGSKGDDLQSAILELEEVINEAESVLGHEVSFPRMFN